MGSIGRYFEKNKKILKSPTKEKTHPKGKRGEKKITR